MATVPLAPRKARTAWALASVRTMFHGALEPRGDRLGEPADPGHATGGGDERHAVEHLLIRELGVTADAEDAEQHRHSSLGQVLSGREHDGVTQRAAQPGLIPAGEHVTAHVDEQDEIGARGAQAPPPSPAAIAAGPASIVTSRVGSPR